MEVVTQKLLEEMEGRYSRVIARLEGEEVLKEGMGDWERGMTCLGVYGLETFQEETLMTARVTDRQYGLVEMLRLASGARKFEAESVLMSLLRSMGVD